MFQVPKTLKIALDEIYSNRIFAESGSSYHFINCTFIPYKPVSSIKVCIGALS